MKCDLFRAVSTEVFRRFACMNRTRIAAMRREAYKNTIYQGDSLLSESPFYFTREVI